MKVVAFLPVKGNSERIPNKNLSLLDGKPLFLHTLDKLIASKLFDTVYLDTDSEDIINIASERNCEILKREPEFATNKTDGNALLLNEAKHVYADIYVQALCTSPFIEIETIKLGIELIKNSIEYDSAFLTKRDKLYTWGNDKTPNYDLNCIPNSISLPDTLIETMGLYIIKRESLLKTGRRIGDCPALLQASPLEAIDVNFPEDFKLAQLIESGRREEERKLLNNIKGIINSSILSDTLDDLGYPSQIIKNLTPNIKGVKILGRAKTLKLRSINDGEDFKGIYDALNSYKNIVPSDVILVENDTPEYAYFGGLNAQLAIKCGVSGVVVGGMTRDGSEVLNLGLPVFSSGLTCQDVRKRAVVDHMNRTIRINQVTISPEDLIFGDDEGIVVIPKIIENKVLELSYKAIKNEKNIAVDISLGASVDNLVKDYGFF